MKSSFLPRRLRRHAHALLRVIFFYVFRPVSSSLSPHPVFTVVVRLLDGSTVAVNAVSSDERLSQRKKLFEGSFAVELVCAPPPPCERKRQSTSRFDSGSRPADEASRQDSFAVGCLVAVAVVVSEAAARRQEDALNLVEV